jgi:ribonuclease HI
MLTVAASLGADIDQSLTIHSPLLPPLSLADVGTLELIMTGAIATTLRLFRHQEPSHQGAQPPSTPTCPFCDNGEEDVFHIFWTCSAWSHLRTPFLKTWHEPPMPSSMLYTHGLAEESIDLMQWRRSHFVAEWSYNSHPLPFWAGEGDVQHDDGRLQVYTDGACNHQDDCRLRSAGCGIYVCAEHPWNTSFALPGVVQSSELAELRALLHIIEGATSQGVDINVKLDNQYVADTAADVLAGSCNWPANGHVLWHRLHIAQQVQIAQGCSGHSVQWIKGHATLLDVTVGIISAPDRLGNFEADRRATAAAASRSCPTDLVSQAQKRGDSTPIIQRYMVEVLLSRYLHQIEHREQQVPTLPAPTGPSAPPPPDPKRSDALRAAFLSLLPL